MIHFVKRSIVVASLLAIAGCSSAPLTPALNSGSATAAAKTGGGTFTATYSGGYNFLDCTASGNGHFKLRGKGSATYLHGSLEVGKMTGTRSGSHCVWSGKATLTSRRHSKNSVTFSLGLNGDRYHNPCNNAVGYVVKRGRGKFVNASGYGTVTFTCANSNYSDAWSGTLSF